MEQNQFTSRIAQRLQLSERSVNNTIELLNDGPVTIILDSEEL